MKGSLFVRPLALVCLASLASGCIGGSNQVKYMKEKPSVPHFVAILPPTNRTSDHAAPDTMRRAAAEMLLGLGIIPVVSPAQESQMLDLMASGENVVEMEPKKVADALGVDGLLYITINQFNDINAVVYAQRVVGATLKLLDREGVRIWEIEGTGYNRSVNVSPGAMAMNAGKALTQAAKLDVVGQVEKMLNVHLLAESQMMAGFMSPKLPVWPKSDKPFVDVVAAKEALAASKAAAKASKAAQ